MVDIVGGDNKPFLIIFQDYKTGDAPVRIDNFCEDLFLKVSQENSGQVNASPSLDKYTNSQLTYF